MFCGAKIIIIFEYSVNQTIKDGYLSLKSNESTHLSPFLYTLTCSFFNIRNGYKEAYRHIRQDYTYTRMQSSSSSVLFPATGSPLYFA